MLLGYHVMASAFFSIPEELPSHIKIATAILEEEFKKFPDSALFLFNQGRLDRLKGDGAAAIKSFERCIQVNADWSQLKHLCHYELGWGTMAQGKWGVSREHWEVLERESKWCPAFYVYMKGLCLLRETQDVCKAAAVMGGIPNLCKRRFSGKQIPIEAYVNRKVENHELDTGRGLESVGGSLAVLEILYLWNMLGSLSPQELAKAEADLDAAERTGAQGLNAEVEAMRLLILGNVFSYTGRYVEALANYRKASEFVPQQEKWVWPHAKFEIASLLLMSVSHLEPSHRFASLSSALAGEGDALERATKAKAIFKEVDRFKQDFNFEIRLKFKMQAALKHAGVVKAQLQKDAGVAPTSLASRLRGGG
jgi:tetratricopeptide (TPR) repeat protein